MKKSTINFEAALNFSLGLLACFFVRLIPFRAPNVEPILATAMPISGVYGALTGSFFGVSSVLLYDLFTRTLGPQTFFTAAAYGILGFWAGNYFKNKKENAKNYVRFAIMGTLLYDALTGLTVGPMIFHETFAAALLGQIPFTLLHLIGNIAFAALLSPAIYKFMVRKKFRIYPKAIPDLPPTLTLTNF